MPTDQVNKVDPWPGDRSSYLWQPVIASPVIQQKSLEIHGQLFCPYSYSRQQYNVKVSFCFRSVFMERFDRSTVCLSCVLRKRTKTYRCVGTERFEGLWNDYALPNGFACTCSTRQDWEKMYSTYVKQRILYFERMGH